MRGMCHKAKDNRIIQVNHRLNELKQKAKELLFSEKGLIHRSKRPVEVEAVFGQLKSNNKFTRFTMRGKDKVELEFLMMALGHNLRKMVAFIFYKTDSLKVKLSQFTLFAGLIIEFLAQRFSKRPSSKFIRISRPVRLAA